MGGLCWVPLKEVFSDLGAILHPHKHLVIIVQRLRPKRLRPTGRVLGQRDHDGKAVLHTGHQFLEVLNHLDDPFVPSRACLIGRREHRGEAGKELQLELLVVHPSYLQVFFTILRTTLQ